LIARNANKYCSIDINGFSATFAAYIGGFCSGAVIYTLNKYCECLDYPPFTISIALLAGAGTATLSFFASNKLLNKIIGQDQERLQAIKIEV
jgi:hypothetical protein